MTIEQLRRAHQDQPFRPFVINLADGRAFPVRHPENLAFSPSGRTIMVAVYEDDTIGAIDLLLVTSLTTGPRATGKRRNGRR